MKASIGHHTVLTIYPQKGRASWYGKQFHGKLTASGKRYNMYSLTAAHRFIPLGSYVRVTNLRNKRSIVVLVDDRGPWIKGRTLDLSYEAARRIDMTGVENVEYHVVAYPTVHYTNSSRHDM
jgi:rare lipoprotein A